MERDVHARDIQNAAWKCVDCYEIEPGKFEVVGPDLGGELFVIHAVDDAGVKIITVHDERSPRRG